MTPTDRAGEREAIVAWLRAEVGAEAVRMILAAGMPGGTRTERVKRASFADGVSHACTMIREAIERGDHLDAAIRAGGEVGGG